MYERHRDPWITFRYPDRIRFDAWTLARDGIRGEQRRRRCCSNDYIGIRKRNYRNYYHHRESVWAGSRRCSYSRWRKRRWLQRQLPRNGDSIWYDISVCDSARSRSEYWRDCAISPFGRLPLFCCVDYKQCRRELELVEYPRLHHQSELSADRSAALGMEQLVGRFRPFVSSGLSPGNLGTRRHSGNP